MGNSGFGIHFFPISDRKRAIKMKENNYNFPRTEPSYPTCLRVYETVLATCTSICCAQRPKITYINKGLYLFFNGIFICTENSWKARKVQNYGHQYKT